MAFKCSVCGKVESPNPPGVMGLYVGICSQCREKKSSSVHEVKEERNCGSCSDKCESPKASIYKNECISNNHKHWKPIPESWPTVRERMLKNIEENTGTKLYHELLSQCLDQSYQKGLEEGRRKS